MRILFDLTTPKTTLMFRALGAALRERSHEVRYTSRDYRESNALQKKLGMDVEIVGRHGGRDRFEKAIASAERQRALIDLLARMKPDVVVCLSSVEASRAAFGLGIPIACFNDLPEATLTGRLTLPLATIVLAPAVIPPRAFERFGAPRVVSYDSFDPMAWLPAWDLSAWPSDVRSSDYARVVVFRESETEASYLADRAPMIVDSVRTLAARHPDWLFVGIPRYSPEQLHARLPLANVTIPADVVNTIALVASADLFLGGGGTMNIESAYFGTPTLCCRPMTCIYEQWLIDHDLAHRPAELTAPAIVAMAEAQIDRRCDAAVLRRLPFPFEEIVAEIERLHAR